jgi:3-dehydroquinate synthase
MSTPQSLEIKRQNGSYTVHFLPTLSKALAAVQAPNSVYLIDSKVFELYSDDFASLPEEKCISVVANEENKTFGLLENVFAQLIAVGFKKNSNLVVVGGGILQDIGGFAASVFYRGVSWDLIPTTLLAQADSCIGSKTSVNLPQGKNLLGTFYPPRQVLLTTSVLKTLSPMDICSGLCEAVKLGIVDSPESVVWMRDHLGDALKGNGLDEFLSRALQIKKKYIEEDEFDRGVRNLLNFGHTFAHAFESVADYEIPHGIAVGIGIKAAFYFSSALGLIQESLSDEVSTLFEPLTRGFDQVVQKYSIDEYVKVMRTDKKNSSGDITFILARGYGQLFKMQLDLEKSRTLLSAFIKSMN